VLLVGNKLDLANDELPALEGGGGGDDDRPLPPTPGSEISGTSLPYGSSPPGMGTGTMGAGSYTGLGSQLQASTAPEGREVGAAEASRWASGVGVPVTMEVSAFSGEGVDEVFGRLARMILTKIELGEIDPDDPMSGIQYGDSGAWNAGASDGASVKSGLTLDEAGAGGGGGVRRRRRRTRGTVGLGEWEDVFTLSSRRRGGGCAC
jgi:hypothetical protein